MLMNVSLFQSPPSSSVDLIVIEALNWSKRLQESEHTLIRNERMPVRGGVGFR